MTRIVLPTVHGKSRPQALRQHHTRQRGYIGTEPSRRPGRGGEVTARRATDADQGAAGSTIAMLGMDALAALDEEIRTPVCSTCWEPLRLHQDGACPLD